MKKNYVPFVFFAMLSCSVAMLSCSVDNEEINTGTESFLNLNAVVEINGCESESFSFGNAGTIEVINDSENLYVSIVANDMYGLNHTKLHVADSEDAFPTVGQGNLPPGKMEYKESFEPAVGSHTFEKISLSDYEGCIYIASQSVFSNGAGSGTYWAGDIAGKSANWSYFEYCIQTCEPQSPPCELYAGPDNSITLTFSEAAALPSWDEVRKLYLSLLASGVSRNGSFDPSIWVLINDFNERGVGTYTTTYTITNGECSDSVELSIIVEPDNN